MQEVLMVEDDDDDSEDIEIFEKESDDIKIVEELINFMNPSSCQFFFCRRMEKIQSVSFLLL